MESEKIPRYSSTRVVKGNQPLLLTKEPGIWTIASGAMALFAVKRDDRLWEGARRYSCSLEVNERPSASIVSHATNIFINHLARRFL